MNSFQTWQGAVVPIDRMNIDTDAIIPKEFLKRIERTGFGQYLFYDWRFDEQGKEIPEFEMNQKRYQGASILLTRANFGCGSSREHAPWAILDYGIRCVIAPSFADIFYNNCFKNGILPVCLDESVIDFLFKKTASNPGYELIVDLVTCNIFDEVDFCVPFKIEEHRRQSLLQGLDDISLTLKYDSKISQFEKEHA